MADSGRLLSRSLSALLPSGNALGIRTAGVVGVLIGLAF